MQKFLWILYCTLISSIGMAAAPITSTWNDLLRSHVRIDGGVDYQGFSKDIGKLSDFIASYEKIAPPSMSEQEKLASYINLYNATMIYHLLTYAKEQDISVTSPEFLQIKINQIKVPGGNIWNGSYKVNVAGLSLTLDDIEHGLIRGQVDGPFSAFKVKELDPRIHAAVNCAALSCPRVREKAYDAANLDTMLTENIKEYLTSPQQFQKLSDSKLKANSIVYWYYEDFDQKGKTLGLTGAGGYLAQFISDQSVDGQWKKEHLIKNFNNRSKVGLKLSPSFEFDYNWRINDIRNK